MSPQPSTSQSWARLACKPDWYTMHHDSHCQAMTSVPPAVVKARQATCAGCPAKCLVYTEGKLRHQSLSAACPQGRWPSWVGLGDAAATILNPAAKALGLKCTGCPNRIAKLNELIPNVWRPWAR